MTLHGHDLRIFLSTRAQSNSKREGPAPWSDPQGKAQAPPAGPGVFKAVLP